MISFLRLYSPLKKFDTDMILYIKTEDTRCLCVKQENSAYPFTLVFCAKRVNAMIYR